MSRNKKKTRKELVKKISKPYMFWLILDSIIMLGNTAVAMYMPWMVGQWLEGSVDFITLAGFASYLSAMGIFFVAKVISGFILRRKKYKMVGKFRCDIYGRILKYPMSFYNGLTTEMLTGVIIEDSIEIRDYIFTDIPKMFVNFITIVSCISMLFTIDPAIAGVMITGIPICILATLPIKNKLYKTSKKQKQVTMDMRSNIHDTLYNIEQVKISGRENKERSIGKKLFKKESTVLRTQRWLDAILSPLMSFIGIGLFLVVGGYSVFRIIEGYITFGGIISFMLYFTLIVTEVVGIILSITKRDKILNVLDRVHEVYECSPEQLQIGEKLSSLDSIEFSDVAFSYGDKKVLDSITFNAKKGEMVALVGGSGAGKSTIFSLIEMFYNQDSGEIKINGVKSNAYSLNSVRNAIAYVNQNCTLMECSIRDNLTYGIERNISDEELFQYLKVTGSEEFVNGLPLSLNFKVVEGGKAFSGGQRQKLALTRAIIKDFDLLLLDEATASLDSASEALIERYVRDIKNDKLVIMIAHRLSTIVTADNIIVLKDGVIVDQGNHKQLLRSCPYYKDLVDEQFIDTEL